MFPRSEKKRPDSVKGPTANLLDTALLYIPVFDDCSPQPSSHLFFIIYRDIFKEFMTIKYAVRVWYH